MVFRFQHFFNLPCRVDGNSGIVINQSSQAEL